MASKSLSFLLFGEDVSAGKAFKKLAVDAEASGGAIKGAFSGKNLLAVGALTAGLGLAGKAATDFQSSMLLLQTQAGQSADTVKTMSKAVLDLAGKTGTAPEQLATSLYHIVSTGLEGSKALDALRISAEGAKVGHADLEATTNALTSAVASGIPGVKDMSAAMGSLNAIVGAGDMKMQDLTDALGSGLLTVVKGYGLSLRDVGGALATFGDNNIRGADAATMLRLAVQSLAKPAAEGHAELKKLGLTETQLATDMQTGGLNKAMLDLTGHLHAAGVSGVQTGAVLTDVFGKKAGPGLAVLAGQMDRFETKLGEVDRGGKNFGADWATWTKSNQGQMDLLHEKTAAFEIEVGNKLLPTMAKGITFANAHSKAIIEVGGAIVGLKLGIVGVKLAQETWNAAAAIGAGAQRMLGGATTVTTSEIATQRSGLVAWSLAGRESALTNDALAASNKGLRISAIGAAGGLALVGAGGYLAGMKLSSMIESGRAGIKVLGDLSHITTSFSTSLVNNGGKLDDQTKGLVQAQLQSSGLADKAARAGITTDQLTGAVTGNAQALGGLIEKWKASGKPADDTIAALTLLYGSYHAAADAGNKAAGATDKATDAAKEQATVAQLQARYDKAAADELAAEAKEALSLKHGLDELNASSLDVKSSQLSFLDSIHSLTSGIQQNGHSLADNSAAGRSNQEAIIGSIKAAQQHATALEKSGKSAADAGRAYLTDEAALRKAALGAGFNKTEVDKLIKSYGGVPDNVRTSIQLEDAAAAAKLAAWKSSIAALPKSIQAEVKLNGLATAEYELERLARNRVAQISVNVGGGVSGNRSVGGSAVFASGGTVGGHSGPTADDQLILASTGEEVISAGPAAKHRPLLKAINAGMFASGGTVGAVSVASQQGTAWTIGQDLPKLLTAALGSPAALAAALSKLINDVHRAVSQNIAPDSLLKTLELENGQFAKLAAQRKYAAAEVASGTAKLNALRASYNQEVTSVAAGVTSGFDLTGLGAGTAGGPTTVGQVIALLQGKVNQAGAFTGDLSTLRGKGLTSGLVSQLGNAGVGSAGGVAGLLAGASGSDLKLINSLWSKDQSFGNLAGRQVAGADYGAAIGAATKFVGAWTGMTNTLNKQAKTMAAQTVNHVSITVNAGLGTDPTKLGRAIVTELQAYVGHGGQIYISKGIR